MRFAENQTMLYLNKSKIPVLNIENSVPVKGLNPPYMKTQSLNILKIKQTMLQKSNWQIEMRFAENQTKLQLNKSEIPVLNIENSVPVKGLNP